jgi:phosphoribosyl 1,2-cyclic phosphate phosphodiesterase
MLKRVVFLGTGTSHGIPVINCDCKVCHSADPHNQRYRAAIYVETTEHKFVIDTPPEFRLQALRAPIRNLDFLLFTHAHSDHVKGLDDVRRYNEMQNQTLAVYGNTHTLDIIKQTFAYIFTNKGQIGGGRPHLELRPVPATPLPNGLDFIPIKHGQWDIYGYRCGNMAYLTDCSAIPAASFAKLQNLQVLILGALRYRPHPTHFNLEQAIAVALKIGAQQTFFTHICHDLEHSRVNKELPPNIQLAYDNLELVF